jgi:hypothetical protein
MLDVPPNTLADQEHWRPVVAMSGNDFNRRCEVQYSRSLFIDHIDRWSDRVPQYYAGSSEAVEALIESLRVLKTFNAESADLGAGEEKD